MTYAVALLFFVGFIVSLLMLLTAQGGRATHPGDGYGFPAKVHRDPHLRVRANAMLSRWAVVSGLLFLAPLLFLGWRNRTIGTDISTATLVGLAVWGLMAAAAVAYPLERIKKW